jgi:large repetitive protein
MSADLGDLTGLSIALGLLGSDGEPRSGWFADPARYLRTILTDDGQREALLETADDLLGGSEATRDAQGRTWLPVFENGPVAVFVVLDDTRLIVHVGLGVRLAVVPAPGEVGMDAEAYVPLFASGASNALLLGEDDATVEVSLGLELPPTADTGSVSLDRVEASAHIPTGGPGPTVGLTLLGLRLPGAAAPTDVVVEADSIDDLDDALLALVLGLLHAATSSLPAADPARGLAGVLGLVDGDDVPELPVADVIARGPAALADWIADCLSGEAREPWLGHLASLLGATVDGSGDAATVHVPVGGAVTVVVDVATTPGTAGLPVVTPRLSVEVDGAAGATLAFTVEPVSIDLATGAAVAVPSLTALARVGSGGPGDLLGPVPGPGGLQITIGSFEGGFSLDADRRPLLVLAALDAVVGSTPYDRLDLTDGDALAGVAAQALADAAATLLDALGGVGDAVGVLLGLTDPPDGPAPRVDPVELLADPVGALRDRWLALLGSSADTVRSVLQIWQETTAAAAVRTRAVTGDGTPSDPYRVALTDGVDLLVTRSDGAAPGSVVTVVLAAGLGEPLALGAEARADLRVGLLRADLAPEAPSAQLLTGLLLVASLAGVEGTPIRLTADGYGLSLAGLGARVSWDPAQGARVDPWLDAPRLLLGGVERPLAGIGAGGPEGLELPAAAPPPVSAWAPELISVLEDLAGAVLRAAYRERSGVEGPQDAVASLLGLALAVTGWGADANRPGRLSLAGLIGDPGAELRRWVGVVLAAGGGSARLPETVVGLLARLLGSQLPGAGVDGVPWALTLPGAGAFAPPSGGGSPLGFGVQLPSLVLALGTPSPDRVGSRAPVGLIGWLPGEPGLSSDVLAEGISADAAVDDVLADALAGRGPLAEGFDALIERWGGTDGVVALPDDLVPAGVTAHRPSELPHTTRLDTPAMVEVLGEVWEALGGPPTCLVEVGVVADGEPDVLPAAGDSAVDLEIDLTLADAPVEAFAVPGPAPAGTTVVRLAGKAGAAASGGGDGFAGQVARLRRVFEGLTGGGTSIVVVAAGAAGQPAVQAAGGLDGVAGVVTVATPWTPLSLDDVDTDPAAGALRMLRTLIELSDADVAAELESMPEDERDPYLADDEDLALARALVDSLLARDGRGDPLTELSAPELPLPPGPAVHAVIGSCSPDAVRRALTAAVAAGLASRSRRRVLDPTGSGAPGAAPARGRLGIHLPAGLGAAVGGLRVAAGLDLDLIRATDDGIAGPALRVRLRIAGDGRWLAGGPDTARAPGPRPLAVRAATLDLTLALPGWGVSGDDAGAGAVTPGGRLVLHDATAFGIHKTRWSVDLSETAPLLPEVRALLGEVAAQLEADADDAVSGLVEAFTALGILDASGGFDSTTLATLLVDPAAVVGAALADPARTSSLAAALRSMVGDVREAAGSSVELRAGDVTVTGDLAGLTLGVSAGADLQPGLRIDGGLAVDRLGVRLDLGLGPGEELTAAGLPGGSIEVTASIPVAAAATLTVNGTLRDPRGAHSVALWPAGPETPAALIELLPDAAAATALSAGLGAIRSTLRGLDTPEPAAIVDALLAAAGLLRGSGNDARIIWPSGLVSDPGSWLEQAAGDLATTGPALVDALAGLLQATAPPPGTLPLADGVSLRASSAGGRLAAALEVDAAQFAGGLGDLVLTLAAGASVAVSGPAAGAAAVPELSVDVGAAGVGALRLRVGTDAGGADGALGVTVSLVPDGRPEIVVYPAAQGLAGLADAAAAGAVAALPPLLTRLAAEDPADPASATTPVQVAGRIVARAGQALGLASGTPAVFDEGALAEFAADPAAVFEARAASIAAEGLALVVDAVEAVLGTGGTRSVTTAAGRVALTVGPPAQRVVLGWSPGAGALDAAVTVTGLDGVDTVTGGLTVSGSGVEAVDVAVGPAPIPIGIAVTLSPFARVAAGASRPGPTVDVGLGAGADTRLVVRFAATGGSLDVTVLSSTGPLETPVESGSPDDVALAVVATVLEIAGSVVLGIGEVQTALGQTALGTATVTDLLDGAVLTTGPVRLDPGLVTALTDADDLLRRLAVLVANAADAMAAPVSIGGVLDVRVTTSGPATDRLLGLTVSVTGDEWIVNPGSDIQVGLVTDASWIDPVQPAGITLQAVRLRPASIEPAPGVVVGGVGTRFSRSSGPLLDTGITIDSVSLLGFGLVSARPTGGVDLGGGARVEIAGLGVALGGGGDGSNPVAEGLMPAGGADEEAPAPRFSPALAVQKHPGLPLAVSLVAGSGSGPWWLAIQREFGPIYLEQVGLAVDQDGTRLKAIAVLIDGKVSLFGLSAAVDDLSFTYTIEGTGSPFDPSRWRIDVAGFAVTADLSGVTLAGGLRKFTPAGGGIEYLGMLLARLSVYGLTVYGGFGRVGPPDDQFDAFFLFGAVNGPIGGPPAFFVTGIGGGFGANRDLVVPPDLSQFNTYPLIKALDPAARAGDPFTELDQARAFFPAERGQFWFAAGLSFTSFAVVDGVVVVAVEFGNGFELNILGLARMALPDESLTLVSIELALVARVSTEEGVVLVQAQLTDNSWLLSTEVRLTGGFAFASWFSGANRGQFVLTLGGYHPDFHRDGYPVVPRLGLSWRVGDLVSITGESYFALTSEALMAGIRVEIHASIGPAWAHLVFGADGIVYFDPFWLNVTIYASIDAGVTVDLWFAEVTFSVHLSARLTVTGPPFRAVATFEVGPVSVTFAIGPTRTAPAPIEWDAFVSKYLEEASPGVARSLAAITGAGTVPPAGGATSGGDQSPDGQPDRPFRVVAEFTATVTSTIPITKLVTGGSTRTLATSRTVSVAPMGEDGDATPTVTLRLRHRKLSGSGAGGPDTADLDQITALISTPKSDGAYPVGAWGEAQDLADPKVPAGDVITATDRVELVALAAIPGTGAGETLPPAIPYRQVEVGGRRVNPLLPSIEDATVDNVVAAAAALHETIDAVRDEVGAGASDTDVAAFLLVTRGERPELEVDSWRADLASPVLLGSLGEGLAPLAPAVEVASVTPVPVGAPAPRAPRVLGMLASGQPRILQAPSGGSAARARTGTTVSNELLERLLDRAPGTVPRLAPATRAGVGAALDPALPARLVEAAPAARPLGRTVVAAGAPPVSGLGPVGAAAVSARAGSPSVLASLRRQTSALLEGEAVVADGQVTVLELPDANTDTNGDRRPRLACREGRVRAVLLGASGRVLADTLLTRGTGARVPVGTRIVVVVGGPALPAEPGPWWLSGGWAAGRPLPSASDGLLVAAGSVVDVLGVVPYRGPDPARVSWAAPAELLGAERGVATTLAGPDGGAALAAVAVAMTGSGTEGLAIGLRGAEQVGELVVTTDASGAGVAVAALDADPGAPVRVTVAADPATPRGHLGVVAAAADPGTLELLGPEAGARWLARSVADTGLIAMTVAPTAAGPGRSTVAWEVP